MIPSLLAALALSAPVPKTPPIDLSWKFTKGDVFYVTHVERQATTADLGNGLKIDAVVTAEVVYQVKVTVADASRTELQLTFVCGKRGVGDRRKEPVAEAVADLPDRTVTVTLNDEHSVTAVDGADDTKDGLGGGFVREWSVRERLGELLGGVPRAKRTEGDTWTADRQDEPGSGLKRKRTERGTVGGSADGLTTLAVEFDVTVTDGAAVRMVGEKQSRAVTFDARLGRVRRLTETCATAGTIEDAGPEGTQLIPTTQKRTVAITVSDERPKAKK